MKFSILGFLLLFMLDTSAGYAQHVLDEGIQNDIQYGVSIKAQLILHDNTMKGRKNHIPTFRLAMDAGIGVLLNANAIRCKVLPAYHVELLAYYNGIGSNRVRKENMDIISSLTTTLGTTNAFNTISNENLITKQTPLYFFSNNAPPPLINPFNYAFTLGFEYIIPTTKYKFSQRLVYVGFKIRDAQLGYFNDGGKGMRIIGDRKDRNYTGGLLVAYGFHKYNLINNIEATYLKYTGYNKNTFEVLSNVSFGYTDYQDKDQEDYNRSKWSITASAWQQQVQVNLDVNNVTKFDLQHIIHKLISDPYHIVKHAPGIALGVGYSQRSNFFIR